jgi:hypothetical protein
MAVAVCLMICIQETLLLALPKIQLLEIGAGIVTRLWVEPGFDSQHGKETFLFSTASRPALGPTQPHIQWVLSAFHLEKSAGTYLHLVPRLRMHGTGSALWLYISRKSSFLYIWVIVAMYSLTERWRRMVAYTTLSTSCVGYLCCFPTNPGDHPPSGLIQTVFLFPNRKVQYSNLSLADRHAMRSLHSV